MLSVLVNGVARFSKREHDCLVEMVWNAMVKTMVKNNCRFTAVLRNGIWNFILSPTVYMYICMYVYI